MRQGYLRSTIVALVAALLMSGCGSSQSTPPATRASEPVSPNMSPDASVATTQAATPAATLPSEAPVDPLLNTIVVTVSDRLRVRSEPRVSDDSIRYEPVLPLGTELLVLDGPVIASGYTWYQVAPASFVELDGPGYGWVAQASTDGEPWIATCPPRPDLAVLASMGYLGLRCYGDQEITFMARVAPFEGLACGDDPPVVMPWSIEPYWLDECTFDVFLSPLEGEPNYDFVFKLDPAIDRGTLPDVFNDYGFDDLGNQIWTAVEVTGQYDHPGARTCRGKSVPDGDQPPEPEAVVAYCRSQFVVTSISYPASFPMPTPLPARAERLVLIHFGSGNCEGGALAGSGVPGDGFAIIGPTSSGDLMAQVLLRGGLPNTTYVVQLIQSAGLGGSVEDCFVEDATLTSDSRGDGHAGVLEALLPATIGVFVYVYHLPDAGSPGDFHWTRLIAVGSAR